jgi:hypothetical protein
LYQHPFKDNVNRVTDRILAAVMTGPQQPIEVGGRDVIARALRIPKALVDPWQ